MKGKRKIEGRERNDEEGAVKRDTGAKRKWKEIHNWG